jgi:2-polyprenyl-3-methyl-5-hydroxy-6-metoxy-1,4-benzoquinol methylase
MTDNKYFLFASLKSTAKLKGLKMQNVELYSKNNSYQKFAARKFFKLFGDDLKANFDNREISLIDVGSGCGKILSEVTIAESGLKFSKIVGVDKSEKMLNYSSEIYGSDSIKFHYMDVEAGVPKNLEGQKFDMATSFHVIHHVHDVKKAFETIYDLLDVDGIFGCIFLIYHPLMSAWDALIEKYPIMSTWRNYFTPILSAENPEEILKEYLQESGFEIINFFGGRNEVFDWQTPDNLESELILLNIIEFKIFNFSLKQDLSTPSTLSSHQCLMKCNNNTPKT